MPVNTIHAEIHLRNFKNINGLWNTLTQFTAYPRFVDAVTSVSQLEDTGGARTTEWNISLDGAPLHWVEKDYLDGEPLSLKFEMLDGDFDVFRGQWKTQEKEGGIHLSLTLEYEMNIPVIQVALGDVLKEKFQTYASLLVKAVGEQAQSLGQSLEEATVSYQAGERSKTDKIAVYEIEERRKKSAGAA